MEKQIKLARYRNTPYSVLYEGKKYVWNPAKNGQPSVREVSEELFDYLTVNSLCFNRGQLVVVDEKKEELEKHIDDIESYKANIHTKEEIEKILKGNLQKMKSELNKITDDSEKQFVISVAKEMQDDLTKSKIDFIAEWRGVKSEILFD